MAESILAALLGFKGRKPNVPEYHPVDPREQTGKALAFNLEKLTDFESLAGDVNKFNQQQILSMAEKAIPLFSDILGQGSKNVLSELKGELPADVKRQVAEFASSRAQAGGFGGSGLAENLTARDLGLTSLALTEHGLTSAERWLGEMDKMLTPGLFDFSRMFVTGPEMTAAEFRNTANKWNRDWLANQIAAMPSPLDRALGGLLDWVATTGEAAATYGLSTVMSGMGQQKPQTQYPSTFNTNPGGTDFGSYSDFPSSTPASAPSNSPPASSTPVGDPVKYPGTFG